MWHKPEILNAVASVLLASAFLLAAYGAVQYVARMPEFPLREMRVSGKLAHVTREQLEETVRREFKGNFFTLDLASVRAGFEKLPWVRSATVRRQWPDRLEVAIEEHVPLARWGAAALVNTHGEVFVAAYDGELPLFVGPRGSAKEIAIQYGYFQRTLAAIGRRPVQVHVSPRRAWQIRLDSGLVIELGRERIEPRLERFVAVYARTVGSLQRRLEYADLRYPNGFALRIPELRREPQDQRRGASNTKRVDEQAQGKQNLIVGLDIGTSKIAAIVAQVKPDGGFEVIGMGSHPSKGLKKGVVVNIEATVNAIQRVLEEAELMADCKIRDVYTGIAGKPHQELNSRGMVPIKDREVTQQDVERVIETAKAIPIPTDQQVLHILNQEFIVDGQGDVREPLAMSGVRLEVNVHIVTGAVSAAQNIIKCVRRCGLEVRDLILQPLASATAVVSEDEKELGVCLVDIGGGTTDLAIFTQGAIRHTAVIPIAGDQITNDIAMALRTPTKDAEDIKQRHGCALRQLADPQHMVEVPGIGERSARQLSRQTLAEVIEPRIEELYSLVQSELRRSGYEDLLSSGIVITGGSSSMQGMVELGEEIFHMPVRIGQPQYHGALAEVVRNPRYATAVGLLLLGLQQQRQHELAQANVGSLQGLIERMKSWFKGTFEGYAHAKADERKFGGNEIGG